ncbi:MAG TPA: endonuclease/exonuclease/phosphatase family protein [Frankiaceae bacterium]|jgi:endonuclease/exonuclease/phosphatase (EEP) superfamily protein YafD|nr:endonuclease/exonuclease/phosphatase family protein [Frankiaceae bacterium]
MARVRTTVVVLCWLACALLLLLEFLRLIGLDSHAAPLIAVSTAWPLVTLLGVLVIAGAAVVRRPLLGAAAAVMLVLIISAWWPAWAGEVGAGPKGAPRLRLLALNVEYSQDTGAAASRQIRSQNPDVVVLSELSPLTLRHLDLRQYRYSWRRPQSGAFGQGIWSRWPLEEVSTWSVHGVAMARLTVDTPGGRIRLYQVHTLAPRGPAARQTWRQQLQQLRKLLSAEQLPVIAAGDFNSSRWDGAFHDLLGGPRHLADASTGRGYFATWPSGRSYPPLLPLDHMLVSTGIGVRHFTVLGAVGSDHRAIVADLTVTS